MLNPLRSSKQRQKILNHWHKDDSSTKGSTVHEEQQKPRTECQSTPHNRRESKRNDYHS